jgi:hypothetical protein
MRVRSDKRRDMNILVATALAKVPSAECCFCLARRSVLFARSCLATRQAFRPAMVQAKALPKAPALASVLAPSSRHARPLWPGKLPQRRAKAFGRAVAVELRARVAELAAEIFEAQPGGALDPPHPQGHAAAVDL